MKHIFESGYLLKSVIEFAATAKAAEFLVIFELENDHFIMTIQKQDMTKRSIRDLRTLIAVLYKTLLSIKLTIVSFDILQQKNTVQSTKILSIYRQTSSDERLQGILYETRTKTFSDLDAYDCSGSCIVKGLGNIPQDANLIFGDYLARKCVKPTAIDNVISQILKQLGH